jgi:hypothetical protein
MYAESVSRQITCILHENYLQFLNSTGPRASERVSMCLPTYKYTYTYT